MAYDHWVTPRWLVQRWPSIDTDPCWNPYSFIKPRLARYGGSFGSGDKAEIPDDQNGLIQPWYGLVYCNPPYSNPDPWAQKWVRHEGSGLWLSEASVGTQWFVTIISNADVVWFFKKRLAFYDPRQRREVKGARAGHILATKGGIKLDLYDVAVPLVLAA